MEAKQYDSEEGDIAEQVSPREVKPFDSGNKVKEKHNPFGSNSRKRRMVTESETSENGDIASETTLLIPKKEEISSLSIDHQKPELYGLKPKFLESLGIKPPLAKWVYIVNFRCDKVELKEVFELAGHIVNCTVVSIRERYANIMYSHPLEAVQAVSMFNGQILYGMKLKVTMINPPGDTVILPKGLKDVGPGLGFNGRPLRDIVKHYKKYTKHQLSLIDASLFCRSNEDNEDKETLDNVASSKTSGENADTANRRKYFKITNVEDIMTVGESSRDSSVLENKSKKAKFEEPAPESSSDEERVDPRIVTNLKAKNREKSKSLDKETPPKDLGGSSIQTVSSKPRPALSAYNNRPQNVPISQPTGFPFRPNQIGANSGPMPVGPPIPIGPAGPMGPTGPMGPSGQVPPFHPQGPGVPPAILNGAMMGPVGPNGPMMGPGGPIGPFGPQPVPIGPPTGMMGPSGPFVPFRPTGPNGTIMQGPNQNPMIRGAGPMPGVNQPLPNDVITLQFRNLPPSTTFPLLCDKVSQCGQVLSLQLTTPGCAVARFAHKAHAERCFQFFNGKCIDGCVIEVRFA